MTCNSEDLPLMRNSQNAVVGYLAWIMFALTILSIIALIAGLHLPVVVHTKTGG